MTYRELLHLYKQGKLDTEKKKQVEAEIEKQDAISEFLYEEGEIPDFSDLVAELAGTDCGSFYLRCLYFKENSMDLVEEIEK